MRHRETIEVLCALFALGLAPSCSLIVDTDQYESCPAGEEGCPCDAVGKCEAGLQCRLPGFCVDPNSDRSPDGGSK